MTQETLREAVARILAPHLPGGREFDDMPKNRVQYREWAAIGKCEYNDATQEEAFDAADAAIATMFERLRDPATVHVNMLRGGIAKPSPTNIWHIYGRELLVAMPKEYVAEEKARLLEALRACAPIARTDVVKPVNGKPPYSVVIFKEFRVPFGEIHDIDEVPPADYGSGQAAAFADAINQAMLAAFQQENSDA